MTSYKLCYNFKWSISFKIAIVKWLSEIFTRFVGPPIKLTPIRIGTDKHTPLLVSS